MMRKKKKTKSMVKAKIKAMSKKTPQNNPRFLVAMTLILQPPKPSITEYFSKMPSVTPIIDALADECRCDTITIQKEHKDQNQDTLEDID